MDTGPDSPILAKETIELAHTINHYSRQRAPYFRDLHPATIALVGFLVERNPISIVPRIPDSWPVDRSTLNNAVKEFHRAVSNLGNSEEFRKWERDLAQRNSNTKIILCTTEATRLSKRNWERFVVVPNRFQLR